MSALLVFMVSDGSPLAPLMSPSSASNVLFSRTMKNT